MNTKNIWLAATLGAVTAGGWALWTIAFPKLDPLSANDSQLTAVAIHPLRTFEIVSPSKTSSLADARRAALEDIATEKDEIERDHKLQAFVDSLAVGELPGMIDPLTTMKQDVLIHDLWLRLVRRWGNEDPRAAASWASTLSDAKQDKRAEAMNRVAISWANADLKSAEDWVTSWSGSAERDAALTAVTYEGARTNPVAALQFAVELPPSQENSNLITYSTSEWATKDAPNAWNWAQQVEDPDTRSMLESNIVVTWASHDPVTASRMIGQIAPGRDQDDAIVGVAQHWVQRDPVAARQWVQQLSKNGGTKAVALQAVDAQIKNALTSK